MVGLKLGFVIVTLVSLTRLPKIAPLQSRISSMLLAAKMAVAWVRTDAELARSISRRETRSERNSALAALPIAVERVARMRLAPVVDSARAVSMPIPDEQPVMNVVYLGQLCVS